MGRDEIATLIADARTAHPAATLVESCQRLEAYGPGCVGCGAPQRFAGAQALRHLAEVAAGLHSVVLGEAQILGQVRKALTEASGELQSVLAPAIAAGRALRRETDFDSHAGHLLDRALALAEREPGGRILVLGPGQMGRLVATRAQELGFATVLVAGRKRPENLPAGVEYVPLGAIRGIEGLDVIAGCLGSGAGELGAADLPEAPLLVDLGTPRNFTPRPGGLVTLADLFASEAKRPHAVRRRAELRTRIHAILDTKVADAGVDAASPVGALRAEVERVRRRELERMRRLHPDLPVSTLEALTRSLVNQLFHAPSERLKQSADPAFGRRVAELFAP